MEHYQTYIHTGSLYIHKKIIDIVPLDKSALNIYTNFQTHVLGTQKKRLNETVLLSTKLNVKIGGKKTYSQFYTQNNVHIEGHNASVSKIER